MKPNHIKNKNYERNVEDKKKKSIESRIADLEEQFIRLTRKINRGKR
jgi:hypothetical protein